MERLLTATPKRMSYRKAWDYHGIVMFFSRYIPHFQLYITTVSSARLPLDVTNSIFLLPRGEKLVLEVPHSHGSSEFSPQSHGPFGRLPSDEPRVPICCQ